MRKSIAIITGFILSSALVYFVFKNVDLSKTVSVFKNVNLANLVILAGLVFFEMCIRGLRWKMLISHFAKTSAWQMTKLEAIGLALNNILPLRLGEIARASLGAARLKTSLFTMFATVLVERMLDLITLIILFSVFAQFAAVTWLKKYNGIILAIFSLTLLGLIFLVFLEDLIDKLFLNIANKSPRIKNFLERLSMGAQSFKNKKLVLPIIVSSFCLWLTDALIYWYAHISLNIKPAINFGKSILLLCATAIAGVIPAVPGYFGTFETALQQMLISWNTGKSEALAYAGFVHLIFYFVMTTAGMIFLYRAGNTLASIWHSFAGKK
jgi:uncharacterized protein (TIRG00374 family)